MGRVSDAKERLMQAVTELIWHGSYGSTTIDHICEKAGVKKGSFYYFFESKCDLAAEALDAGWKEYKPKLDAIFSPSVAPLDRFTVFCQHVYDEQKELKKQTGTVLGCPLFTLGAEVCHCEHKLHGKVKEILGHHIKYLESAVRDAHATGAINAPNAEAKARILFAYSEGLMTQARILNSLEMLREMEAGMFDILGAKMPRARAA